MRTLLLLNRAQVPLLLSMLAALASGCMSSSSSAPSAPAAGSPASSASPAALGVSGSLNAVSSSVLKASRGQLKGLGISARALRPAVDLTAFNVVCSTTSSPPVTATGKVNANGTFSLSLSGGVNQPMVCYVTDGSGTKVADFLIADNANKDLNGNSSVSATATYASTVAFGSVNFDADAGEVTVPLNSVKAAMATGSGAAASVFDPSGNWTIGAVDFDLPAGVRGPCTQQEDQSGNCNGPPAGQALFVKLWDAVKTSDSSKVHALQLWAGNNGSDPQADFVACGSKVGLTAQRESALGLDFSANGSADSGFSFASQLTGFNDQASGNQNETVNLTDFWKMDVATTQWSLQTGCGSKSLTIGGNTLNAWSCGPDENSLFQGGLGGGCVDGAGKPVNVSDWGQITANADGTGGMPSNGQNAVDANLIQTSSMSGFYQGKAVTCTSSWVVTDSNGVPQGTQQNPGQFDWNNFQQIQTTYDAGTTCSSLANSNSPDSQKILQLQCYSNYYYQSGMEHGTNACIPKVQTDWTQSDPAKFVHVDFRPNDLVFMDEYKPFPDGKGGSLLTREEEYRGVQVDGNWVNCHVIDTGGLTVKKISDNKVLATYVSSSVTTDKDVAACAANFAGKKETFFFYLTK